jgi:N-methylhydantoinase B/oxoprolinase/acetone carboxylase alpha subunit
VSKDQGIMMSEGDLITVCTPDGGSYGEPFEREPELLWRDVPRGYFDTEDAARDYGVVLNECQSVDLGATTATRHTRRMRAEPGEIALESIGHRHVDLSAGSTACILLALLDV